MHAQKAGDTPGKTFYEYKNSYIMSKIGKKKKELLERKIGGKKKQNRLSPMPYTRMQCCNKSALYQSNACIYHIIQST